MDSSDGVGGKVDKGDKSSDNGVVGKKHIEKLGLNIIYKKLQLKSYSNCA
jgi:restriction endonuclease Mrr